MTFYQWMDNYLTTFKKNKIKKSTYDFYLYRLQALSPLFDIDLKDLNVFDIQNLLNTMHENGDSYTTIKNTFSFLKQGLKKALACGVVSFDASIGVELPAKNTKKIDALSEFEIAQFLKSKKTFYYNLFLFLLITGVRVGEALALDCSDVDFENKIIHINKNFYRGVITTPKTESGIRDIPLTKQLESLFDKRRKNGPLFVNSFGGRVDYRVLLTAWHRQQIKANFKKIYGLHSLRHTFASCLVQNGADVKSVSSLLGHNDIQTTLNFYCHSSAEHNLETICKLPFLSII